MNQALIAYLERPLYIQNPKAWSPEEDALLLAVLVPHQMTEIQTLEQYQELLELRLKAMVEEYEPNLPQTWKEMVWSRCMKLTNAEVFLSGTMNDDELLQALTQSTLIKMRLGSVATFPLNLLPAASEAEDGAISLAVNTNLEEWLIRLTL